LAPSHEPFVVGFEAEYGNEEEQNTKDRKEILPV
jgi:hypothetical protein